ncbi:sensor histidine kinase [Nocardioides plantarum]|uniref:histidine kinase n=2 Tax=Nocardioides plantarum TaxID=29299 RepID=A0ABV5KB76_9ACTN|nr:HAMP domain-containing sensor histidine kinase [Nocardioides plantarum]
MVVVSLPTLLGLLLQSPADGERTLGDVAAAAWPFMMLAAAVGLAVHRSVCEAPASGWLAAATALPPVGVGLMSLATTAAPTTATPAALHLMGLLSGALALGLVALAYGGSPPPRDPLLVSLVGGTVAWGAAIAASWAPVPDARVGEAAHATIVILVICGLALAGLAGAMIPATCAVLERTGLPQPARGALVVGGCALAVEATADASLTSWSRVPAADTALQLLAAVCFLAVALQLSSLVGDATRAGRHRDLVRLRTHEEDLRRARSTLHEARSTVAGIASASRLMVERDDLPDETRQRLLAMKRAEVARLERMLADVTPITPCVTDLSDALLPVVESVRARGHQIDLRTVPGQPHEDADEVARIVHLLLDNAATHGSGPIAVDLEHGDTGVRISVTDAGPGVPVDLADRVFDWGVSGAGSSGIGLHDGHSRAEALGGRLRLDDRSPGITRFELLLPHPGEEAR